jgi:hypothetical protein
VQLQQAVNGQKKTLDRNHKDVFAIKQMLQQLNSVDSPQLSTFDMTQQTSATRLDEYFSDRQEIRRPYTDSEIREISNLLRSVNPRWSKVPRTYVVLRLIGQLNILEDLINIGFSDYWFPVVKQNLPEALRYTVQAAFFNTQDLVLTKSMDVEKGENGQHCFFEQGDFIPFETKAVLGRGGYGQVDKVLSTISFREYARKRVLRSHVFRGWRKEDVHDFITEIEILKRLEHKHVVKYIGSYTDPKYLGLIVSPVAEMDLNVYLAHATVSNHSELRTFFGCLATALDFLHSQNIRHKDIKPGNILVNQGNVLFADFGLSLDFTDRDGSTTTGIVNGRTPRYSAPEVFRDESRNTLTDIWSLGVVFLEMTVVLKGKTLQDLDRFFENHGSRQKYVRTNRTALSELITELEGIGQSSDNIVLTWCQRMLLEDRDLRPSAFSLVKLITASSRETHETVYCGICCDPFGEDFSD